MNKRKISIFAVIVIIVILAITRIINVPTDYFPRTIGAYTLVDTVGQEVKIDKMCNKVKDNDILRVAGKTGDACMETHTATYSMVISTTTSTTTSKVVKVNLSIFTEGADSLDLLVDKTTYPDAIDGQPVFRTAPFRLGWSPLSGFDLIMTEEGESAVSSTTSVIKLEGKAGGDNDVTRYFLAKYPSKK